VITTQKFSLCIQILSMTLDGIILRRGSTGTHMEERHNAGTRKGGKFIFFRKNKTHQKK